MDGVSRLEMDKRDSGMGYLQAWNVIRRRIFLVGDTYLLSESLQWLSQA